MLNCKTNKHFGKLQGFSFCSGTDGNRAKNFSTKLDCNFKLIYAECCQVFKYILTQSVLFTV